MAEPKKKSYARGDVAKFSNVPTELRAIPQWVCWRAEWKEERGKFSKLPVDPATRKEAKSNDPATWSSFDEAVATFTKDKTVNGIGFVFTPQDNYAFVDLDDARDPATGEIGDWAAEIVTRLNSYTEISPSGTGLRIVVEAEPVGPAKRRGKVEIYAFGQYATITGNRIGKVEKIAKRQGELADLYRTVFGKDEKEEPNSRPANVEDPKLARVRALSDDDLIVKASSAANGGKFLKLWQADPSVTGDRSQADAALCGMLAYWTRADAERIDRLFRRSALVRKKWDERRGNQTYGERTVAFACRAAAALYDPDLEPTMQEGRNDIANTEIFIQLHGADFLWAVEWKTWLAWNCHRWEPGKDLRCELAAESVSKELVRRAQTAPDPDAKRQQQNMKWAVGSGDGRRVDQIEKFSRRRLDKAVSEFDTDLYLLACRNGVLDLRTGELRDGSRGDLITRTTDLVYDEKATCPIWDKFLKEIMEGDMAMVSYLWRVIGYCLTGDITERAFFLFHGEGRNGKSTWVETLKALLGPPGLGYAQKARFSTFLQKTVQGGANDDIAHFAGARVVIANEADERASLDVALVKELTGGDTHRARHLYGREFEFAPQFKLFLVTNKVPPIHETTYAIWDRLHYVPFDWRVPDSKVDRALPLRLLGELPGILAKAAKACREWQKEGLNPPDKVLKAGRQLYQDMDTLGEWLAEETEAGDKFKTSHKDLYRAFTGWARDNGWTRPPSSKTFGGYLRERRFPEIRSTGNQKFWLGLKLRRPVETDSRGEL